MPEKYLLYIDILGFSNLVSSRSGIIDDIYQIIDSLHVHTHDAFITLVFSDTIVVYNKIDPVNDHDHEYIVMYAIEFAKDLLYRLIGKNIFFRATLRYGEFNHTILSNINAFYGPALVQSYKDEKNIPATGMFLHTSVIGRNKCFQTVSFNEDYSFTILNQTLYSTWRQYGARIPFSIPADIFIDLDLPWEIAKDVILFRDIHQNMTHHVDPIVRSKHAMTWQLYRSTFSSILDALEGNGFNPSVLAPGIEWDDYLRRTVEE